MKNLINAFVRSCRYFLSIMKIDLASKEREKEVTDEREKLIHPNKGSRVCVEKYWFGLGDIELTVGTAQEFKFRTAPLVTLRPMEMSSNSPEPNFVMMKELRLANVHCLVGVQVTNEKENGHFDGKDVGVDTYGKRDFDLPTLQPANRVYTHFLYTGRVPTGYTIGDKFIFSVGFFAPATIVA